MPSFPVNNFCTSDLQTLQLALHQQQQNLQQQLQNFLLLQTSQNSQANALMQAQAQNIALQASQQLQQFQRLQRQTAVDGTPKSRQNFANVEDESKVEQMSLTLSRLQPVPPIKNFQKPTTNSRATTTIATFPASSSSSSSSPPPMLSSPPPFTRFSPPETSANSRLDLNPNENIDLEELEEFAKEFKQRRIKLGKYNFWSF